MVLFSVTIWSIRTQRWGRLDKLLMSDSVARNPTPTDIVFVCIAIYLYILYCYIFPSICLGCPTQSSLYFFQQHSMGKLNLDYWEYNQLHLRYYSGKDFITTDYVAHVKITANLWHEKLIKRDFFFSTSTYFL